MVSATVCRNLCRKLSWDACYLLATNKRSILGWTHSKMHSKFVNWIVINQASSELGTTCITQPRFTSNILWYMWCYISEWSFTIRYVQALFIGKLVIDDIALTRTLKANSLLIFVRLYSYIWTRTLKAKSILIFVKFMFTIRCHYFCLPKCISPIKIYSVHVCEFMIKLVIWQRGWS